jgi:hypothetical protein
VSRRSRRLMPIDLLFSRKEWVIGDIFSGRMRLMLALARPRRIALVDDGTITLHLCRLLARGLPLARPDARESRRMRALGVVAGRVLVRMARAGRITLFSYQSLDHPVMLAVQAVGIQVVQNDFVWLRNGVGRADNDPDLEPLFDGRARLLLGSANVADGLSSVAEYMEWVTSETELGAVLYAPHRRESPILVERIAAMAGVEVLHTLLPIELRLAGATRAVEIASRPSSAVDTLGRILDGTGSTIAVRATRRSELAA